MGSPVQTIHETCLVANQHSVLAHRNSVAGPGFYAIQAFLCPNSPHILLEGARGAAFSLLPGSPRSHTHLAGIQTLGEGRFAILDLWSRRFLSARPDRASGGRVEDRTSTARCETFRLTEAKELPERLRDLLPILEKQSVTAEDIVTLAALPGRKCTDRIISALLPLMSRAEMDHLGQALLETPSLARNLQQVFKEDLWINRSLPLLQEWYGHRPPVEQAGRKRSIDQAFDALGEAGVAEVSESAGHAMIAAARRQVKPVRRACVLGTVRNEGIYLLEWVAYHRALGFDEIILYSNNNSDGSDGLLSALAEAGEIIWYNNAMDPTVNAQRKAYAHALTVMPEILEYEWCAIIDIDEFICINGDMFSGLGDFLGWHTRRGAEAIALNWVYFETSGARRWQDAPITRRLTTRKQEPNAHIKTIVRPRFAIASQPHFPRQSERHPLRFHASNGAPHTFYNSPLAPGVAKALSDNPTASHAFVAHYFHKSCEEFLWKFSRNRGGQKTTGEDITLSLQTRFLKSFLTQFDTSGPQQDLTESNPAFAETYRALCDIPAVARAADHVKAAFRERSKKVMEHYRPFLLKEMGEDGRRFMALLDNKEISAP